MSDEKSSSKTKPIAAHEQTANGFDKADLFSFDRPIDPVRPDRPATGATQDGDPLDNAYADASQPATARRAASGRTGPLTRLEAACSDPPSNASAAENAVDELPLTISAPKPPFAINDLVNGSADQCPGACGCPMCQPLMSVKAVASYFGVSVATIWRWCKSEPDFPDPCSPGEGTTRWDRREIVAYHRICLEKRAR